MNDKIKDKLLKLLELSKRGIDGEKDNAESMLTKLLIKHDLSLSDLDSNLQTFREYGYQTKDDVLLIAQIITKVTERYDIKKHTGLKILFAAVSDFEHVQIIELIDYHLPDFKEQRADILKNLINAYIQKHELYRPPSKARPAEINHDLFKTMSLMQILKDEKYTKKLENGNE